MEPARGSRQAFGWRWKLYVGSERGFSRRFIQAAGLLPRCPMLINSRRGGGAGSDNAPEAVAAFVGPTSSGGVSRIWRIEEQVQRVLDSWGVVGMEIAPDVSKSKTLNPTFRT